MQSFKVHGCSHARVEAQNPSSTSASSSSASLSRGPSPGSLVGYVFSSFGKVAIPKAKLPAFVKAGNGKYKDAITKEVTHVISSKDQLNSEKLTKFPGTIVKLEWLLSPDNSSLVIRPAISSSTTSSTSSSAASTLSFFPTPSVSSAHSSSSSFYSSSSDIRLPSSSMPPSSESFATSLSPPAFFISGSGSSPESSPSASSPPAPSRPKRALHECRLCAEESNFLQFVMEVPVGVVSPDRNADKKSNSMI